jgi:hypothetical protein
MHILRITLLAALLLFPVSAAQAGQVSGQPTTTAKAAGPMTSDDEALAALDIAVPGLAAVKSAADSRDLAAVKNAYLDYRRTTCPAKFTVLPSGKPTAATEKSDTVGDEIIRHHIRNSYGFIPLSGEMGEPFDWKANPVPRSSPSYTFEWTYCVISRTGFWKQLADAYWKTLDEKYAQTWVDQFLDFVTKNPSTDQPPTGSLWRTLDASERMYDSWPYCYAHFVDTPAFTPDVQWIYLRSVLDHAKVLKAGLEVHGRTGNWVASECYALYAIGVLFPELRDAPAWRQYAMDRMVKELNLCVPPDGFEAELTPNYHYFTLSSFTGPVKLAQLNQLKIPDIFHEKILAMFRAPVWVMDQRGFDVSTNDSAAHNAASHAREGVALFPDDPLLQWAASGGTRGQEPPTSTMLPYAGFYAMRGGWKPTDTFLFFRAGPTGIAHEHEDMLEIVLRAWNRSLLFEQGTYSYDQSDWRRFVLGTSSHSTIIVDGNGQHRGRSNAPVTQPTDNPWVTTPTFDFVAGTYDKGYQKSVNDLTKIGSGVSYVGPVDRSVTHTRRVLFLKPYYALVLDSLNGTGAHTFDSLYYMDSPAADIDPSTQAAFSHNNGDVQLALYPLDRNELTAEIVQGQMDPILGWYAGAHRTVPTIRFRKKQSAPARFATFVYPFLGNHPAFHAEASSVGDGAWGQSLNTPLEHAIVAVSLDDSTRSLTVKDVHANAAGLIIRQHQTDKTGTLVGGWKLTRFVDVTFDFSPSSPATLVWQEKQDALLVFNANDQTCTIQIAKPFKATADLQPGVWTLVKADGRFASSAPPLFVPIERTFPEQPYADYLNSFPHKVQQAGAAAVHVSADQFVQPPHMSLRSKFGVDHPVLAAWDEVDSRLSANVIVPQAGWYRIKLRYCSGEAPMRSVLIDNQYPFREAHDVPFPNTIGDFPSDGWSNHANDWKEATFGEPQSPGGWMFHLPKGNVSIAIQNDGGGLNLDSIEIDPVN